MDNYQLVLAAFMWADAAQNQDRIHSAQRIYGDGQDRLCAEMVAYAPRMAALFDYLTNDLNMDPGGVYAYEVAGPFGEAYRDFLIENGCCPDDDECDALLRPLVSDLFTSDFAGGGYSEAEVDKGISDFFKGHR